MVEKFNFYDIYGYLIPGLVLIGLLWVPFGLVFGKWPQADFTSAVLILLLAYILGHIVQSFAIRLIRILDKQKNPRLPSDLLLDPADTSFVNDVKVKVAGLALKYFPLDVATAKEVGPELREASDKERRFKSEKWKLSKEQADNKKKEIEKEKNAMLAIIQQRNNAFLLARSALLRNKTSSYFEQFQGLYAMMQGAAAALAFATFYFLGWFVSFYFTSDSIAQLISSRATGLLLVDMLCIIVAVLVVLYAGADKRSATAVERWSLTLSLLAAALFSGLLVAKYALGILVRSAQETSFAGISAPLLLLLLALAACLGWIRCLGAYRAFAREFAMAVWRDFANIEAKWARCGKEQEDDSEKAVSF